MQLVIGWFFEGLAYFESEKIAEEPKELCIPLFQIRTEFMVDILRSTFFSVILGFFSKPRRKPKMQVPSYNMHELSDFSADVECQVHFMKYLKAKDQQLLSDYSSSLSGLETDESMISEVFSKQVQLAFRSYCKTVSFQTLFNIRLENDRVAELGLEVNR